MCSGEALDSAALGGGGSETPLVVLADDSDELRARAVALALRLNLPLLHAGERTEATLALAVTVERLELRSLERGGPGPVFADFVGGSLGYTRRLNRFGELFRAVGIGRGVETVVDATAGLGHDAFLLASAGCRVTAIERCPIVAALLEDGLERARLADADLCAVIDERLRVVVGNAFDFLSTLLDSALTDAPDAIYLDPMYPPKKKSALVKKEMRVLRRVVGDDPDAGELLRIARRCARKRVVVKRMRLAEELGPGVVRSYCGKTTRFDVYE